MRNFITSFAQFLGLIVTYFLVMLIINTYLAKQQDVPVKNADYFVTGSSFLEHAIDPSLHQGIENICTSAEPYYLTFLKLEKLFEKKIKPKTLLLGFSPHNLSSFNERKLSDPYWKNTFFYKAYPWLLDFLKFDNLEVNHEQLFSIYFKNMCLRPKLNHINFYGGYKNVQGNHLNNAQEVINFHFYHHEKPLGISDICLNYLDSIISLCQTNQITPILVNAPVHRSYKEKIPEKFTQQFDSLSQAYKLNGVQVLKLDTLQLSDNCFYDSNHLNQTGAQMFTPVLFELVEKN